MPRSDSAAANERADSIGDDAGATGDERATSDANAAEDACATDGAACGDVAPGDVTTDAVACICNPRDVLDLLARKHAIPVVCAVGALEPARYRDVDDALGDVSSSTLSARLEDLVDAGILAREQYDEIPPRVEYELTSDGRELCDALAPLVEWARDREGSR